MITILLALSALAADDHPLPEPPAPCGTPMLWAPVDPIVDPPRVQAADLLLRDAYDTPNVATSEHFAVRWGNERFMSGEEVDSLLDAFERSWAFEIGEMGHTAPYRTDEYFFNVYIGDTGDGAPPGYGAGGYYTADAEGWPMIVMPANTVEQRHTVEMVAAHEFYHAIQAAEDRYVYRQGSPGAWYWEATATWVAQEVLPDDQLHARFLFGYAFFPHYPVNFFDYPDVGLLQEYYQYGAFLFPVHVSQATGSWEVIRDSWREDLGTDDPLEALRILLDERGLDLDQLWLDHIARNATWDYPAGPLYEQILQVYAGYPESQQMITGSLDDDGTDGWVSPPADLRPQRYGANTWRMGRPDAGTYTFTVEADATGSDFSSTELGVTLVIEGGPGEAPEYRPLTVEGTTATLVADDLDGAMAAWLVIGTWTEEPPAPFSEETFDYRVRVDLEAAEAPLPDTPPDEPRGGCGCDGTSGVGGAGLLVGLLALGARRRRC